MTFRFPWVSRRTYDIVVRVFDESLKAERAELSRREMAFEDERRSFHDRYNTLLDKYHSLIERKAVVDVPVPATPAVVDLTLQAAHEKWGNDPLTMPYVNRFIADQRARRERGEVGALDEDELLERVIKGSSSDDGVGF